MATTPEEILKRKRAQSHTAQDAHDIAALDGVSVPQYTVENPIQSGAGSSAQSYGSGNNAQSYGSGSGSGNGIEIKKAKTGIPTNVIGAAVGALVVIIIIVIVVSSASGGSDAAPPEPTPPQQAAAGPPPPTASAPAPYAAPLPPPSPPPPDTGFRHAAHVDVRDKGTQLQRARVARAPFTPKKRGMHACAH